MKNLVAFDIETIPDTERWATLHQVNHLTPAEIANAMFTLRRSDTGSEFLPPYYQQVITISVAVRTPEQFRIYSLGDEQSSEADMIRLFFQGIERLTPMLISWNGTQFDCPVLHYRSLLHSIHAPRYWDTGQEDTNFRWNNYLNRYHERHLDLMDVLACYSSRCYAPLDLISTLLGYPGKLGLSGDKVWDYYQAGDVTAIRNYCEIDVLNTYLIYLRFQQLRGRLVTAELDKEYDIISTVLADADKVHFKEFLKAWKR